MRKVDPRTGLRSAQMRPECCDAITLANSQAQASATLLARVGCVHLLKTAKTRFKLVSGDSAPMIFDGKNDTGNVLAAA